MDEMTFLFYLAFIAGAAYYAHQRGRSPVAWGLASIIISPLIAVIILAIIKDQKVEKRLNHLDTRTDHLHREVKYNQDFNNHRAQVFQDNLQETRQIANRVQPKSITGSKSQLNCSQCGYGLRFEQSLCPNCGLVQPNQQIEQFQLAIICPLKTHISHLQNLLMQACADEPLKEIEYLDMVTGQGLQPQQKKLVFVVSYYRTDSGNKGTQALKKKLLQSVENAGYEAE
jgi:hypothetical protein